MLDFVNPKFNRLLRAERNETTLYSGIFNQRYALYALRVRFYFRNEKR